jgi:hypothetical protein
MTPAIWRRLLVPDDMPLLELGAFMVGAMGWNASHLFAFEVDGKRYDIRFEDGMDLDDSLDMQGVIARDVLRPGIEAALQYDFGDDWWHRIEVVDHRAIDKDDKPPRLVDGERACPPDDSGGPFGFAEMLDAVADPDHSEHEDMRDWLGDFDAAAFDKKKLDRNAKRVVKAYLK